MCVFSVFVVKLYGFCIVSFPNHIFHTRRRNWVWSTAYSIFVQVRQNAGALCILASLKITFHTACQRSISKMDVDRATLAAGCRLGYSIFRKEHKLAVSESAVY